MIKTTKYWAFFLFLTVSCLNVFSASLATKEQKPIQAVIFDCDGVLVDTEFLKFQSWQKAAKNQGFNFTLDDYLPLVGQNDGLCRP